MTLHLLFSHRLTPEQEADARESLEVDRFQYLPPELQALWSQVPPELEQLDEFAQPLWRWLAETTRSGDWVLVQGDFGLSHATVNRAKQLGLKPVYATTKRESKEVESSEGKVTKTLVFRHIRFRAY